MVVYAKISVNASLTVLPLLAFAHNHLTVFVCLFLRSAFRKRLFRFDNMLATASQKLFKLLAQHGRSQLFLGEDSDPERSDMEVQRPLTTSFSLSSTERCRIDPLQSSGRDVTPLSYML